MLRTNDTHTNRRASRRHSVLLAILMFANMASACGDSVSSGGRTSNNPPSGSRTNLPGGGVDSPRPDADRDGVPDDRDQCADSPSGAHVGVYGCPHNSLPPQYPDADQDGVPDDRDLCSATSGAEVADTDGCGATQSYDESDPSSGDSDGFVTFRVDGYGGAPIVFRTRLNFVNELPNGFEVTGTLLIETPLGHVPLAEASVILETRDGDPNQIDRIVGTARVPMPDLGLLEGLELADLATASVGLDYGRNLDYLEAPLQDDRRYLFFDMSSQLEVSAGPVTMAAPGGTDATLVFDPLDPMFYVTGDLFGLGAIGTVEDIGFGLSLQGLIPFSPLHQLTRAGFEDYGPFDGHFYLKGRIPLTRIPIAIAGEGVIDIDPDDDGATPFNDAMPDLQIGVNGEVDLSVDFLDFFHFGFNLGSATVVARLAEDGAWAYLSGRIAPDLEWLPEFIPLVPTGEVILEGLISDDVAESYLYAEGTYSMDLSGLGELTGLDLGQLYAMTASVDISRDGIFILGEAEANLPDPISLDGRVAVEAFFNDDVNDWYVMLTGALSIDGVALEAGSSLRIDSNGARIEGNLESSIVDVRMAGTIARGAFELTGEATVTIDVNALREIVETVQCGFEWVTDGAVCGYEWVTDAAVCGWDTIVSGTVCGYEYVTDAVTCGVEYVNCGWQTVTSAVECGLSEICDFFGFCDPATCDIYVCDEQPLSCYDLSQPLSCEVPRSCEDLSQPKSCEDLSSPTYCEEHVQVPDFDWGTFTGTVSLTLDNSGFDGRVTGSWCPSDSASCVTLAEGRVRLGNPMEVCVDVAGLGEYCVPF